MSVSIIELCLREILSLDGAKVNILPICGFTVPIWLTFDINICIYPRVRKHFYNLCLQKITNINKEFAVQVGKYSIINNFFLFFYQKIVTSVRYIFYQTLSIMYIMWHNNSQKSFKYYCNITYKVKMRLSLYYNSKSVP